MVNFVEPSNSLDYLDSSIPQLSNLNDDCVLEILDRIPHTSLVMMAMTNKRFHELAAIQYRRNNPTKSVCFQILEDTVEIQPNQPDIQIFGNKLLNVVIRGGGQNWHMAEHALHYIADNCSPNLKNLRFERMMLSRIHMNAIRHLLQRVEKLTFHKSAFIDDFYTDLLQHCLQLKHLIISESIGMVEKDACAWLDMEYIHLESVRISSTMATSFQLNERWESFFRRHPTIKSFSCHYIYETDSAARPVKTIERNAKRLERLYLSLYGIGHLNSTYYDLSVLCAKPQFKFLELHVGENSVQHLIVHNKMLATFRALKAVHLTNITLNPSICMALSAFVHLQQINAADCTIDAVCGELLAKGLAHLQRIYGDWTLDDLAAFIRYTPTLKEIHLSNELHMLVMSDGTSVYDLNQERSELPNASVLTIYLQLKSGTVLSPFEIESNQYIHIEKQPNEEQFNVKYTFSSDRFC